MGNKHDVMLCEINSYYLNDKYEFIDQIYLYCITKCDASEFGIHAKVVVV